jgi:hypothetical protein
MLLASGITRPLKKKTEEARELGILYVSGMTSKAELRVFWLLSFSTSLSSMIQNGFFKKKQPLTD